MHWLEPHCCKRNDLDSSLVVALESHVTRNKNRNTYNTRHTLPMNPYTFSATNIHYI